MKGENNSWLNVVTSFPVSLLFVANVILAVIFASQIFFFYTSYVVEAGTLLETLPTNEIFDYFTHGIERFVISISFWIFSALILNMGSCIFIFKTKKAIAFQATV